MIETNSDDVADELLDEFEEFEQMFEEEKERALREAKELARERVPVDEGDLRDDITIDLDEGRIFNTLDYAIYQDQGTIYIEPTHYLTDSARDAFQASIERLRS